MSPSRELTVLMAVRNGAPYLHTAIESILRQTYAGFQFLIVDDASTDDTRALVRAYDDPRIELLCLERNVGQTAALNVGVRHAATPWIARMDADDYSAPTRLEEQLAAVQRDHDISCLGTYAWIFHEDPMLTEDALERPIEHAMIRQALLQGTPLIHGSLLVRREALLDAGSYDERYRYSADRELYTRFLRRYRAANLPRRLLGIRRHREQGSFTLRAAEENIEIFSRMLSSPHYTAVDRRILRGSLSYAHLFRVRCAVAHGRYGSVLGDVIAAFRIAPVTAIKQCGSSVIPERLHASLTRRLHHVHVPSNRPAIDRSQWHVGR